MSMFFLAIHHTLTPNIDYQFFRRTACVAKVFESLKTQRTKIPRTKARQIKFHKNINYYCTTVLWSVVKTHKKVCSTLNILHNALAYNTLHPNPQEVNILYSYLTFMSVQDITLHFPFYLNNDVWGSSMVLLLRHPIIGRLLWMRNRGRGFRYINPDCEDTFIRFQQTFSPLTMRDSGYSYWWTNEDHWFFETTLFNFEKGQKIKLNMHIVTKAFLYFCMNEHYCCCFCMFVF